MAESRCVRLATCAFRVADWQWPFALEHAEAIARDWQRRRARMPQLFNGTVYLLRDHAIDGDTLSGTFFKTDFSTFLYWREHRFAGDGDRARRLRRVAHPFGRRSRAARAPGDPASSIPDASIRRAG